MDLNFAILGCGRIAKKHAEILAGGHVKGGQLTAVCDIKEDRAKTYGEKYEVPYFTDMHQMMESVKEIDVVVILTESGAHADNVVDLATYGKHLVVEKPMALTVSDADRMIRACDEAGVSLFVVKQNRYNLAVQRMRIALEEGRFGKLVMGSVRVRWCRTQEYYNQDPWRGTWEHDGGVFSNQASHHVDLLEWMLGDPISVFAKSRTALVDIEAEDTGVALITFENGALGIVEATTATRPKDLEGSLSILGETGTVVIGGFAVNEITTWNFLDSLPEDEDVKNAFSQDPPNVYGFGHIPYMVQVVESIKTGTPGLVDGLEGRRSLELISAIYESVETEQEVSIRFRPEKCRLGYRG
jgi:UDP-N-acetyl-2-amino-2-deoxyglucuronate dehydrogenase